MIKWLVYIVFLLICTTCLLSATTHKSSRDNKVHAFLPGVGSKPVLSADTTTVKTVKQTDDKKKIKEVAKAKRQSKPEKVDDGDGSSILKAKPKRERRPAGLQRPPEIPRRNGN